MHSDGVVFSIFLIFTGAALLAALALYARQSLLVAYIVLGALVGPWGLALVSDPVTIQGIGHVGIDHPQARLFIVVDLFAQPGQRPPAGLDVPQ